jgi:hypothetical protein
MSEHAKTLVIMLVIMSAGSWLVMEIGPRACSRTRRESAADVAEFAHRACDAIVRGDRDAYRELLARPADVSADERYGWLPYAGAKVEDFTPWTERAIARMRELDRSHVAGAACGAVVDVVRSDVPADARHGRIAVVAVEAGGRVLEIGPSVLSSRGRILQGSEDGGFARWRNGRPPR